ncbi:hypothetical protein AC578_3994 [Pseudocercospora eumusae]|uniref:Uncharacterized protein n=1 Tax=Pseudocercospora eumusae TaxID=321146 RepID=A0A139HLT8_9PEZI|nr:hypothetical protein AC578_3994 [Pseudocercospora eumusae]
MAPHLFSLYESQNCMFRLALEHHRQPSTAMATTTVSAHARAINTFELLEQILLLASEEYNAHHESLFGTDKIDREVRRIKAILKYQRVCRAFRDTIANSTPLQAVIFSAPPKENSKGDDSNKNPMVCRSNLALSAHGHMAMFVSANHFEVPLTSVYLSFASREFPLTGRNWNAPEASWRKMFLYAGAYSVESFIVQLPSNDPYQSIGGNKQYVLVKLTNPTLGQLVDKMYEVLGVEPWRNSYNHTSKFSPSEKLKMASASPSAGARVAGTFELLEQILLDTIGSSTQPEAYEEPYFTGMRTVLLSQRTCRTFQETIANSTPLQKELYLSVSEPGSSWLMNPLLRRDIAIADGFTLGAYILRMPPGGNAFQVILNRGIRWRQKDTEAGAEDIESESWRKMYLFNMPYAVTQVELRCGRKRRITGRAENPTFGHLWDAVIKNDKGLSSQGNGDVRTVRGRVKVDWDTELQTARQKRLPDRLQYGNATELHDIAPRPPASSRRDITNRSILAPSNTEDELSSSDMDLASSSSEDELSSPEDHGLQRTK